jgi:hypothetical protein
MPSVTMRDLAQGAYDILGILSVGETMSDAMGTFARTFANDLLSEWSQGRAFIPVIARESFAMVADQGGPDNPYTIGDGADFDTQRPATQTSIVAANLILAGDPPLVRVPLGIYTDQAYAANQIPTMSNSQPTGLYYNPTYASDWGSIFLWPVPDTDDNTLELFLQKAVAQFEDLDTEYFVPEGLPRALKYNLADAMAGANGKQLAPSDARIAVSSLSRFKRANTKLSDLMNDAIWSASSRTIYNINSGAGGS